MNGGGDFKFTLPMPPMSQAMTQQTITQQQAMTQQPLPQAMTQQVMTQQTYPTLTDQAQTQQQQLTSYLAALNESVQQLTSSAQAGGLQQQPQQLTNLAPVAADFATQAMQQQQQQPLLGTPEQQQQQQSMIGLLQSSNPDHDAALQGLLQGAFDVMDNPFTATLAGNAAVRKVGAFDTDVMQQQQQQQQQLWNSVAAASGDTKPDVSNVIQNVNQSSANIFQALSSAGAEFGAGGGGGLNAQNLNNSNRKVDNRGDSPDSARELSISSGDSSPKCSSSQNSPTAVSCAHGRERVRVVDTCSMKRTSASGKCKVHVVCRYGYQVQARGAFCRICCTVGNQCNAAVDPVHM